MPEVGIEGRELETPNKPEKEGNKRNLENKDQKIIMQVENLSKTYSQGKIPVHALRCACITVRKGELLAIMGPSGSGKSTLLALIDGSTMALHLVHVSKISLFKTLIYFLSLSQTNII